MTEMTAGTALSSPPTTAAGESATAKAAAATLLQQRIATGRRPRGSRQDDSGHDFSPGLQLAVDKFGVGAVGNAKPHANRSQLRAGRQPDAPLRDDGWQRRKQRINRRRRRL